MTHSCYDCYGKQLKYENILSHEDLEEFEFKNGEEFPITDIRHPYNKKIQNHISLIIGVVEAQVNTNTKFDL